MRILCCSLVCMMLCLLLTMQVCAAERTDALLDGIDPESGLEDSVLERIGEFDPAKEMDLPGVFGSLALEAAKTVFGNLREGLATVGLIFAALIVTGLFSLAEHSPARLCGVFVIGAAIGTNMHSMVNLGLETMRKILDYTGILLPGLASLTAGAGFSDSASALYLQSSFFLHLLTRLAVRFISPLIYVFLGLSIAEAASGHPGLTTICEMIRSLSVTILKVTGYVFTGLQGVVSVTARGVDENKLKAARLAMSGAVPMVGGILSDAAQSLFTAAGWLRSAVGTYGVLAVAGICLTPFFRIALQQFLLRITHGLSGTIGTPEQVQLLHRCCQAMDLVMAMVGTFCLLSFLSIVLFLRGGTP